MKNRGRTQLCIILLVSGWLVLFGIIPLFLLIITSLLTPDEVDLIRFELSLAGYRQLIDPAYLNVALRSAKLALITTVLCLFIGYPFAWYTSQLRPRWRNTVLILLMIPFWTNSLVRTYAIRMVLGTQGLLNKALLFLGIIESPIRFMYTEFAVVMGMFYLMLPFMILPLYASVEKLNIQVVEAARDLGSGIITTFSRIVIPLTMPGIVAGCVMVFVPAMGLFYVASLLGGAKQLLVGNLIQQQFLNARNWPLGSAMSVILILIMTIMLMGYGLIIRRISKREGSV